MAVVFVRLVVNVAKRLMPRVLWHTLLATLYQVFHKMHLQWAYICNTIVGLNVLVDPQIRLWQKCWRGIPWIFGWTLLSSVEVQASMCSVYLGCNSGPRTGNSWASIFCASNMWSGSAAVMCNVYLRTSGCISTLPPPSMCAPHFYTQTPCCLKRMCSCTQNLLFQSVKVDHKFSWQSSKSYRDSSWRKGVLSGASLGDILSST